MAKKKGRKRKRKIALRILLLVLLMVAIIGTVLAISIITKNSTSAVYVQMEEASLPLVSLSYNDDAYETVLHGYVSEMNNASMRDVIVPLSGDKTVNVTVRTCGSEVTGASYQLRSLDDAEYVDGGEIPLSQGGIGTEETLNATLKVSELIESGTEYRLMIILNADGREVTYYTRVLYAKTQYTGELLDFAMEFSQATCDREKAAQFIVNYIRPGDTASTTDYYYTDITSKYAMLTYGTLEVKRGDEVTVRISELEPTQLSVSLEYELQINEADGWQSYRVDEFFCVRFRSEKVYLLDYYRTLEQRFNAEESTAENGRILLGVGSGSTQVINSDNNAYTVFVQDEQLWSYNSRLNSMSLIFSFANDNDTSERSAYDHHAIQVVRVSDDGSVDYMVYGYMNRGIYEGQVGICFYRYSADRNATERLFFMPVSQSEQMLMTDLGTLAYVNDEDVCYLRYGDGIYSIDLNSGETVEVSIRAYPGMYAMNERGNVVAWQEGENLTYPERLVILNMDSQTTIVVNAPEGEYVKILDFIGDDIVYGFGRESDSVIEANIDTQQLLTSVLIASTDEKLEIRQEYKANGFYILSADVEDKRIVISRGEKNTNGGLKQIEDDVLLLTQPLYGDTEKSMLMHRDDELMKNEYYIQIGTTSNADSQFSTVIPRFETEKEVNVIRLTHHQADVYYVYGGGRLLYVESEINKAIDEAYNVFGVVVDENMDYLWTRGTRDLFKTISIQPFVTSENECTLGSALRVLCAQEGIQLQNVETLLENGENPIDIIDGALKGSTAVNLYGCTLSEVLYFVNLGHPVLAITGNREAVIICGYDTSTVSIYFPSTGITEQLSTSFVTEYFEDLGNAFISYR